MKKTVYELVKKQLSNPSNYDNPQSEKVEKFLHFVEQQEDKPKPRAELAVSMVCANGSCELPALAKSPPFDSLRPEAEKKLTKLIELL